MPPATDLRPDAALELWPSFTKALEALLATGVVDPIGCCRTSGDAAVLERNGVEYYFEPDDHRLAQRVADVHPAVVHIHGLGFTRLMLAIRHGVGRSVPILLQHHGEPPPAALRVRAAQRITRRVADGYLFTGAERQAEPFRRAGVIGPTAPVYEVLESASHLASHVDAAATPELTGDPCVLWVGRLIPSKDPVCAVRAISIARSHGSNAQLHMLATERSLESDVRRSIESLGLNDVVHLHVPVAHPEMAGWYRRADVYLSSSHREGSNYSLIEALGFGCLPVVTDIPSHAAIVKELARRFAIGDADGAGALLAVPRASPSATGCDQVRDQIRDHARRNLSWSAVADQLSSAYRTSLRS
jgi:glycosyltransferase involved in cell wall biosynthesis